MSSASDWGISRFSHVIPFLLQAFGATLRRRGVTSTAKIAWSLVVDLAFDWQYGTDTMRWAELSELQISSSNKIHGGHYQPTKARPFRRLLCDLDLPRQGTFVDLGAGKGRVLLLAALAGFKRVRGVEFSAELCGIARQNVRRFVTKTGSSTQIEILEEDVATYRIRGDETIFFMYNPFGPVVIDAFLRNLKVSLQSAPRDVCLIYSTPNYDSTISSHRILERWRDHEFGGTHFAVYRAITGEPSAQPGVPCQ